MKFLHLYNILLLNRLDDYKLQLKDELLAKSIFNLNNPKKLKMIIKWIKNGSLRPNYPDDIQLAYKAYLIIERKKLDYNKFNSAQEVIDQYKDLNLKLEYNPDNLPCFTNKVELNKGVVIYNVQDDYLGLLAVRRAVDYNWGKDANPWCLITPPLKTHADEYWKRYSTIPKRICFQNGKLVAFSASDEFEIFWWDRNDHATMNIPIEGVTDDPKFVEKMDEYNDMLYDSSRSEDKNRLLQIYLKFKDVEIIKEKLTRNPNCPLQILLKLSRDKDYIMRGRVASNPNCSDELLLKLSRDKAIFVVNRAINNPNITISILLKLIDSKISVTTKIYIANNLNCSPIILLKLSNEKNLRLLCQVAYNSNTPIHVLEKLSLSNKKLVRRTLLYNPKCPKNIIERLCKDRNSLVRTTALDMLNKKH